MMVMLLFMMMMRRSSALQRMAPCRRGAFTFQARWWTLSSRPLRKSTRRS